MRAGCLLVVFFLFGVAAGTPYYPGCRNGVKAIPNMKKNCSALLCSNRYKPVCGSDGEEYHSDCALCKAACSNHNLSKQCDGFCPCVPGETQHTVTVLDPMPSPRIAASGFCLVEGTCPK